MYLYWTFSERDYNTSATVSVNSDSMYLSTVNEWNDWHKRVLSIVNSCFCVYTLNGLNSWPLFGLWPRLQWPINPVFCFVLKPKQFLKIFCCICCFCFCCCCFFVFVYVMMMLIITKMTTRTTTTMRMLIMFCEYKVYTISILLFL